MTAFPPLVPAARYDPGPMVHFRPSTAVDTASPVDPGNDSCHNTPLKTNPPRRFPHHEIYERKSIRPRSTGRAAVWSPILRTAKCRSSAVPELDLPGAHLAQLRRQQLRREVLVGDRD